MVNKKLLGLALGIIAVGILLVVLTAYGSEIGNQGASNVSEPIETSRSTTRAINATYIGSENCSYCHFDIWSNWTNTTHSRKIYNRSIGENASVPLPDGIKWDNVTYVIGFKWKIRYVNETGYIMTFSGENQTVAGSNMWDVAEMRFEDYHPGEDLKPYDCGKCHTTGWTADDDAETDGTLTDNQDGLPGIWGTWNETGVGCEACHGPGSQHEIDNASTNITLDPTSENCGYCHQRAYNGNITEVNPDRKHHEQYNDWSVSGHSTKNVECINCHNPHMTSDAQYNWSNFMNYNTTIYSDIKPAVVSFYNGTDNDINTTDYLSVADPMELCGKCHDTRVQDLDHGNGTVDATCLDCHMTPSRKTINKWDIRSHTFKVNDNIVYTTDPPNNFPNLTCQQSPCHSEGLEHYEDWAESAHADSYHGYNGNTYCAHCMSPFQYEEMYNATNKTSDEDNMPVSNENWTNVACSACHNLHEDPDSLSFFNGSDYLPVEDISRDLCGMCHAGERHTETVDWNASKHGKTTFIPGVNANTYCAHCMSPYQGDPDANYTDNDPVAADDWDSIGCTICHDKHSLELVIYNGSAYEEVEDISRDLCGACHTDHHTETRDWNSSKHASSFHGYNNNSYCAHCMSPYQGDPEATEEDNEPVSGANWTSVGCIVCHDKHSLELVFYNGSAYEEVEDISRDLCGACHKGERHTETVEWNSSVHADSYHGYNGNTYCAHCMSPYQGDPEAAEEDNDPVSASNWTSVGCIVCHDKHSLELVFFNGTEYEEVEDISLDLCGKCHTGDRHKETVEWNSSAHANTNHGYNANTYCAKCHAPFQSDPDANYTSNDPISGSNWTSIGCIVCHDEHSLELAFFNGTAREEPVSNPADLCGECHKGERYPEYDDWKSSVHATTAVMDKDNNNTFCARCHSPFQADIEATFTNNTGIAPGKGTGITCTVCHQPHSLELVFYNSSGYEEMDDVNILCSQCHSGTSEFAGAPFVIDIYGQWKESDHASTYHGYNDATYCAHCMSPFEAGPEEEWSENTTVGADNWSSIGCMVCHDKHSLDLILYNGSAGNVMPYDAKEEKWDTNELCGACHTMGDEELGGEPHHPQIEMRTGTGGLEVEDTEFHTDPYCYDCHGYESNHTFNFNAAACGDCHSKYENISVAQEQVDEWQDEIEELLNFTYHNLSLAENIMIDAVKNGTWTSELNDTYYTAVFNYYFVEGDASTGAHNAEYAKKLLESANDKAKEVIDSKAELPEFAVSPANDAVDIAIDTVITIDFEQDINFSGISDNGYLTVSGGVTGDLTYDNTTFVLTFTPSQDLAYNTTYTVTLNMNSKYADDSPILEEEYEWSFTTEKEIPQVEDIDVQIGPIKDKDGKAVEGATVKLTIDGETYTDTTDENGYADFSIPASIFKAGSIDIEVSKADFEDLEFSGTVDENGTFTPPTGGIPSMKAEKVEDDEDNMLMWIVLIVIIIIVVIVVFFLLTRKKEAPAEGEEEEGEEGEEEEGEAMECPECGADVAPGETECQECGAEFEVEEEAEEEEGEEGEEAEEEEGEEGEEEETEDDELGDEELEDEDMELGDEELEDEELEEDMELEEEAELGEEPVDEEDLDAELEEAAVEEDLDAELEDAAAKEDIEIEEEKTE